MNSTIIGCGWLGLQVGEHLSNLGNKVFGSYRSSSQKNTIAKTNIEGFELNLDLNSQISTHILENTEILILSLPPINRKEPDYFASVLTHCARQFPSSTKVIFTSTIGIYPQKEERFTEAYIFEENEKNIHYKAESALKELLGNRLTILRLGGLIGPNRHPAKSLQGRSISNDGSAPINLIHSADVCKAISAILKQNAFEKCYNLVFETKISKKNYYSQIIEKFEMEPITFGKDTSLNRSVDGSYICSDLNFNYSSNPQYYSEILT